MWCFVELSNVNPRDFNLRRNISRETIFFESDGSRGVQNGERKQHTPLVNIRFLKNNPKPQPSKPQTPLQSRFQVQGTKQKISFSVFVHH